MSLLLGGVGSAGASGGGGGGPTYWTPNDEAGLIAWFDVADLGRYNTTTDTWTARWGSLSFVAASSGPLTTTAGFSGSSNALVFTDTTNTGLVIANPGFTECVFVIAMNVVTTADQVLIWNRALSGFGVAGLAVNSTYGVYVRYGSGGAEPDDYTFAMPGEKLTITRHSNANRIIRFNGETKISSSILNSGTQPASSDSFKLFRDVGDYNYIVQVAAVGLFTSASWSTGLAEKIEGFICHNNIGHSTSILPGGHPYKSTAPTV